MILPLLLCLAASQVIQADFQPCPEHSACLYHSRCAQTSPDGKEIILATTDRSKYNEWKKTNCDGHASASELFVRPISDHKWNITLGYMIKEIGIRFGDSITMMGNGTEAVFKSPTSINTTKIPYVEGAQMIAFTLESFNQTLLDIFRNSEIFYLEKEMKNGSWQSSKQPTFWKHLDDNTPCDPTLITGDCKKDTGTCIINERDSVKCRNEGDKIWKKGDKSSWEELDSVSCDADTKAWKLTKGNAPSPMPNKGIEIECSAAEPAPWTTTESPPTTVSLSITTTPNHSGTILPNFIVPFFVYFLLI